MKKNLILVAAAIVLLAASCSGKYETVKGDPMDTRIATLDNGLKIYMTVNKETPRIQTFIAVRVGGKNDPSDNTGLAHYLEHIMFKGTGNLGTSDYEAEKPLLDSIEAVYNLYRTKTDPEERKAVYRLIDSLSYAASQYSIPNEYDKAMSLIGASGSNAFTSNDVTCYTEDIPSNQIENWARVQADRFKNMVVRGFHTELEAVYEEYNRSLNSDSEKAFVALDSMLFANHPYGLQTVIGTQDHLKNPSISAIKRQKELYYVPNNCAICVSGDFDPDEFVAIVEKYFGDWKPNENLPEFNYAAEEPVTEPRSVDIYGTESEFTMLAWRYPGAADEEGEVATIVGSLLSNGMAGLLDIDINNAQKAQGAFSFAYDRADYGEMMLGGYPKYGQSLEEVRDLLLEEVAKLREGDFDGELITAIVNNYKLSEMRSLENNNSRAMKYVDSFVNGESWKHNVGKLGRLEALTKDDIVAWANKYLGENSYAIVYKYLGIDKNIKKIDAPAITPILTNRDRQSDFLTEIQNAEVQPIEPVYVDFGKDMSVAEVAGCEVLYKKNELNDIASLRLIWDLGAINDPALSFACDYMDYLGTAEKTSDEIAAEMYALACNAGFRVGSNQVTLNVSGLSENIASALDIVLDLYNNAVADEEVLAVLKEDELKAREDNMLNQRSCQGAMQNYVFYGADYIRNTTISNAALKTLTSGELLARVKGIFGKEHTVLYYGPASIEEVCSLVAERTEENLEPLSKTYIQRAQTPKPAVYVAPYAARQFSYTQFSNRGETFSVEDAPAIALFNEYFGGGMNTVVFQEMREARALAYSAGAYLTSPAHATDNYTFYAYIGSQNDKLSKAVEAFDLIINDMPQSDKSFEIARTSLISTLRTRRITGARVLDSYLDCRELGISEPTDRIVFEQVQNMTLADLKTTQEKWIKDRTYIYGILGDPTDLDMNYLRKLGPVTLLPLEAIFGY